MGEPKPPTVTIQTREAAEAPCGLFASLRGGIHLFASFRSGIVVQFMGVCVCVGGLGNRSRCG